MVGHWPYGGDPRCAPRNRQRVLYVFPLLLAIACGEPLPSEFSPPALGGRVMVSKPERPLSLQCGNFPVLERLVFTRKGTRRMRNSSGRTTARIPSCIRLDHTSRFPFLRTRRPSLPAGS